MNFFEHQDQAKRNTVYLVLLLIAAVLFLIAATVAAVAIFTYYLGQHSTSIQVAQAYHTPLSEHLWLLLQSEITLWVALGVSVVVGCGSLYKYLQIQRGGRYVAETLGGQLLVPDSADPTARKILNVVEEMAIASGNPVPPVYLLEDTSINAFAAGFGRRDAVIGITRGAVELLSRDELQGVMAHEFSHIHNGDMRLNMRLLALLNGVLLIGLIGYFLSRGSSRHHYRSRNGKGQAGIMLLGLALMAIGYGGTLFGNMIKAAVSRQREFLADASAVQFTRYPAGIAGALKKIGGLHQGALLNNEHAAEFSHMYFGQGVKTRFSGLMATHPPLAQRIRRIDPRWDGDFTTVAAPARETGAEQPAPVAGAATAGFAEDFAEGVATRVGKADPVSLDTAQQFIQALPATLTAAAHTAFSARAVVYCLLLNRENKVRQLQVAHLQSRADPATFAEMRHLYPVVNTVGAADYLDLVDLCIPALKQLSAPQYNAFKANLNALIKMDRQVTLQEWCLFRVVTENIESRRFREHKNLKRLYGPATVLLRAVADAGQAPGRPADAAYAAGIAVLGVPEPQSEPPHDATIDALDRAVDALNRLKPLQKPRLLKAVATVIQHDRQISPQQSALLRTVADVLGCPLPPLQPQPRASATNPAI